MAWISVKDQPFPRATTLETRKLLVKTHHLNTIAVNCSYDHSGEEQPKYGPNWYFWGGYGYKPLDPLDVAFWQVIDDND